MNKQDIQQLSIYTQSLFLFAVRHENSSDDNLQGNTFKTLPEIKYWLETKGWIVYIWPEFYKDGFCFNWQVFVWDKSDTWAERTRFRRNREMHDCTPDG